MRENRHLYTIIVGATDAGSHATVGKCMRGIRPG
ncbi:hypothetical protein FOXG_22642 [Fusarium oxysporum f. sp. lycopersici 4287]|uniref:Uncharacterized protein n=2 Tax=Fusarium oxysporum TaxID=5507 RepID=A0A0J9WB59_FUSO4|nr:uncharacterized protein FOXG_22642 [Fusarium oxysporum f. sp. lycopersici 4287]EXK30496.1 hypothetical protein FOMG_13302 [Fusarium oxysporum f. sp. melonis 26406]KNB19755.1 hypothetical protein FOXG_22642 [Fusarium oxysporum f. sp. lycopersici 4287]